jgi:X-Pro dipeptidyl-peptidase (S15 family)/X-Pro dipeptidyl-peptidase C-terminal non-catalytic domain
MRRLLLAVLAPALLLPAAASAAPPLPFGHPCTAQSGTRFCPTTALGDRVASFDGVPLDVDVTLPATGNGPFPTIVMLHGYGGDKTNYEASKPEGDGQPSSAPGTATTYHWNSNWFARRGYAVVNASARGFGRSCGQTTSRTPDCAKGWIHLADQRYEARDVQYLLGLLADQGVARPGALGVTGISYGGGQSLELAFLRDRIRNPDGSFAPWRSPHGTPLSITAAYPRWPWSDLVNALIPNGRYLDFRLSNATESREPIGVPIQSYLTGLYASGAASGFYSPSGVDPGADLTTWFGRIQAGEPYGADARGIADEIHAHHQGFGIPGTPAPLLLHGGWTDDLFPSSESLRIYNALRAADPNAPVSMQLADLGHARGSNKVNADKALNDEGSAFLDAYLRGVGGPPAPGSVTAYTQTCPQAASAGGPFTAESWPALHPGAVTFGAATAQTVASAGGDPQTAQAFDPISGGGDACRSTAAALEPGTAAYTGFNGGRYTLMGRPTVSADIETSGANGQLASRLWDVGSDGTQVLVTRGVYRLTDNQRGRVTFQLSGNGYRFEPGHAPRLELLGRDAPAFRAGNGSFSVKVSNLRVVLPVAERPGSVPGVGAPPAQLQALGRRHPRLKVRNRLSKQRVLRTTGRLILPRGVTRKQGCRGRLSIQVKARKRTISTRRPFVRHKNCRFASKVRFRHRSRFGRAKRLTVRVRFGGNAKLTPASTKVRRVRIRR